MLSSRTPSSKKSEKAAAAGPVDIKLTLCEDLLLECWSMCPSCLDIKLLVYSLKCLDKAVLALSVLSLGMFVFCIHYSNSSWDDSVMFFDTVPCGGNNTNTNYTASSCQLQLKRGPRPCQSVPCNVSVCVPPSVGCCNVEEIKVNPGLSVALGACNGIVDPWQAARTASNVLMVMSIFIFAGVPLLCIQCQCICIKDWYQLKLMRQPKEMKRKKKKLAKIRWKYGPASAEYQVARAEYQAANAESQQVAAQKIQVEVLTSV